MVRQARGWLAAHPDAPAALRRIVVEQLDDFERALRAQAACYSSIATSTSPPASADR